VTGADQVGALLVEFSGEIRQRLDGLAAAVDAGDADDVLRRAHTLKGSARTLALPDLAAAMERLEEAYRSTPVRVDAARDALAAARLAAEAGVSQQDAVGRLSHALRTPLNVVLGFAHLLRSADLGPEAQEHADAIVRAAGQMAALIDEATAGTAAVVRDTAPVSSAVQDAAPVTVLYVEDDPASARLVGELLGRVPAVRFLAAGSGAEGVALARHEHPDLVLLDPGLPDIPGEEVLRLLHEGAAAGVPVIVLVTGESRPERLQELREAGAAECVIKPVDLGRLQALVESVRPRAG
jgi:CheY-like chemotaxis protein/HPt (histidine-containing phosphotransfer) domain-containing protein